MSIIYEAIENGLEKIYEKDWKVLAVAGTITYGAYWSYSFRPKGFPPGPIGWPFVGTIYHDNDLAEELLKLGTKYGPVFSVSKRGVKPCVIINDFDVFNTDIKPNFKNFAERPYFGLSAMFEGDKGIVLSSGSHWAATRLFGSNALKEYGMGKGESYTSIWVEADALIEALDHRLKESKTFDVTDYIHMAVTNVIARLVFGTRFNYDDPVFAETLCALQNRGFDTDILRRRLMLGYGHILALVPNFFLKKTSEFKNIFYIFDYIDKKVEEARKTCDRENPKSVLDHFIIEEEKNPDSAVSEPGVLARCIVELFIAGSDTTQNIIRWALQYLCLYTGLQEDLYQEYKRVVGPGTVPEASNFLEMPILNAFIHEVMRFVSLIPQGVPHAPFEDCVIGGYLVPAGFSVFVNQHAIHRDPRYWKYPDSFDIRNFLDQNGKFESRPQFMPFGWGKRICLGSALARVETLIFISRLIQQYKFSFPPEFNMEPCGDNMRKPSRQPIIFESR